MAQQAVEQYRVDISLACKTFSISETCYRYQAKLSDENALIADWLVRLTHNQKNWGFGLYFLFLSNVKSYLWNHKRVYRIYRELKLNLRIKPKKRIVREKPEPLVVLEAMKMEHTIKAPRKGMVTEIFYNSGDLVNDGAELIAFEAEAV